MPPCLTLSIIRYGSRVKWSNPGKGVAPSPTHWCSKLSKREPSGHPRLWLPTLIYFYLLLYILWDDWPIFMISASNEHLQQEFEYTLLKPDCHSWWMQSGREDTLEERYAIKFCSKLGKNATETYRMPQTAFGPSCMNRASVFEWHKIFKEGRESVRNDKRCGRSKEVNTPELIGQRVRVRVRVTMLRF